MAKGGEKRTVLPKQIIWKCFFCSKKYVANVDENFIVCSCGCHIFQFLDEIF